MIWFWIFMFFTGLLIPLTMILFGSYFCRKIPSKINSVFGYRTARSMRNQETWKFAHIHYGKNSRRVGWLLLVGTVAAMLLVYGQEIDFVGKVGSIVCFVQVISIIASMSPTEAALKRNFHNDGKRKDL